MGDEAATQRSATAGSWRHPQAWRPTGGGDLSEGRCKEKGNSTSQRGWVAWATEVKKESEAGGQTEKERVGGSATESAQTQSHPAS